MEANVVMAEHNVVEIVFEYVSIFCIIISKSSRPSLKLARYCIN